jgi:hypothetical protein
MAVIVRSIWCVTATFILSAIVPTIIAQRYFTPAPEDMKDKILAEGEEG